MNHCPLEQYITLCMLPVGFRTRIFTPTAMISDLRRVHQDGVCAHVIAEHRQAVVHYTPPAEYRALPVLYGQVALNVNKVIVL